MYRVKHEQHLVAIGCEKQNLHTYLLQVTRKEDVMHLILNVI